MLMTKNTVRPAVGLLIALQVLIVVLISVFVLIEIERMREDTLRVSQDRIATQAKNTANHLTQNFNLLRMHLETLPAPQAHNRTEVNRYLMAVRDKLIYLRSLSLLDAEGEVIYSTDTRNIGVELDIDDFEPVQAAGQPGALQFGPAWVGRNLATGRSVRDLAADTMTDSGFFLIVMPMSHDAQFTVVAAIHSGFFINESLSNDRIPGGQLVAMLDQGDLLFSSDERWRPENESTPPSLMKLLLDLVLGRHGIDTGFLTAKSPSLLHPFYVQTQVALPYVLTDWKQRARTMVGLASLLILTLVVISSYLTWRVYRLLKKQGELFKQTAQLAAVFTQSRDGILIVDDEFKVVAMNPALESITGYDKDSLLGVQASALFTHWQTDAGPSSLHSVLHSGEEWRAEIIAQRRNGSETTLKAVVTGVSSSAQYISPQLYVGTYTDVSLERAYERQLMQLSQAVEQSPSSIVITDLDGTIEYVNASCLRSTGYDKDEIIGQNPKILASGLTPVETYQELWKTIKNDEVWRGEFYNRRKNGSVYVEQAMVAPMKDADGNLTNYIGIKYDITYEKQIETDLKLAASVMANTVEGVVILDAEHRIIDVNAAFTTITGYTRDEVLGEDLTFLSRQQFRPNEMDEMYADLAEKGYWQGESWNVTKDGRQFVTLSNVSVVRDENGDINHYIHVFDDITQFKSYQNELERLAHFDALTGLPNRTLLQDRLQVEIKRAQREKTFLAVCFMDLDHFKKVNDSLGHEAGDELLQVVAKRLKASLRASDTAARIGGDEFVLLLPGMKQPHDYEEVIHRVLKQVAVPIHLQGHVVGVSGSLGVTVYPNDPSQAGQLLRNADHAMYLAKQAGRNRYVLYDAAEDANLRLLSNIRQEVCMAIERDEFFLRYQPLLNLQTQEVIGFEALLRWQHPQRGVLVPDQFLPVAGEAGMFVDIDRWVVRRVFAQFHEWYEAGVFIGAANINVSVSSFNAPGFVQELRSLCQTYPEMNPNLIELEILESLAINSLTDMHEVLTEIREMGFRIALDDFGTGFSSLALLRHLPMTTLKIDKSFVQNMFENRHDLSIVESVIRLAGAFRLELIAEGVETLGHAEALFALGCSVVQGYGVSVPLLAQDVESWLAEFQSDESMHPFKSLADSVHHDHSLAAVSLQHRLWVNRLEALVFGEIDLDDFAELDERACFFYGWLEWAADEFDDVQQPLLEKVKYLHHELHEAAKHVVQAVQDDNRILGQERMEYLYDIQVRFIKRLHGLMRPS